MYYRPSDVGLAPPPGLSSRLTLQLSARIVSDFRLLLAAIHTDTQPLSNVRGKCHVRHKDRIDDLVAWKKLPDRFYFVKFYDPYIKREYDMVRTETVNNSESASSF